jgi:hypothetical protein
MFVKFECGCVGILDGDRDPILVDACDRREDGLGFWRRDMSGKSHKPLEPEEKEKLIGEIDLLLGDAYRYREVRRLLGS